MAGNWMRSHMSRVFLTPCLSPRHSSRTTPHPLWPRNTPDSERATDSGGGWPGEGVQRRGGGGHWLCCLEYSVQTGFLAEGVAWMTSGP